MRSLITGGAGFIGSHLADHLISRGDDVVVLDDLSTGRFVNVEHLRDHDRFEFRLGNITDKADVDGAMEGCDRVFHLAAAVGVNLIVEKPIESMRTNIVGSEIVIDTALKHGAAVLVTSTSEIYGKNATGPVKEGDDRVLGSPLKSRWSYSTAKAVEEILAYTYWREKGLPTVIVRLFNTVGPRQTGSYGMVIPRFVQQAVRGQDITVYGTGQQSRCFLHVADAVPAMVDLLEDPSAHGEVFNIGSSEEITIEGLAHRILELVGGGSSISYVPYEEAYEEGFEDMLRRMPDTTKAYEQVGFAQHHALDDIIRAVVEEQRS